MELPIVTVNAMALQYDPASCQWKELGSESGPCTLAILKSPTNEYRYVGQKTSTNELVLNAYIFPDMKYDQSTPTFHQWYDKNKNAFGLNFADSTMATKYAVAMADALEQLNIPQNPPKSAAPAIPSSTFSNTPTIVPKKVPEKPAQNNAKSSPYATTNVVNITPNVQPTNQRAIPEQKQMKPSSGAPPPPGPPPAAPAPPGPPPPGPAPPKTAAGGGNDFASQLRKAAAEHKEVKIDETLNKSMNVAPDAKSAPTTQAPAPSGGGMDIFAEMRQRMQKKPDGGLVSNVRSITPTPKSSSSFPSSINSTQSTIAKPTTPEPDSSSSGYVTAAALEKFRIDLMNDIVQNMEKMKNEIISSISAKLN